MLTNYRNHPCVRVMKAFSFEGNITLKYSMRNSSAMNYGTLLVFSEQQSYLKSACTLRRCPRSCNIVLWMPECFQHIETAKLMSQAFFHLVCLELAHALMKLPVADFYRILSPKVNQAQKKTSYNSM